MTSAAPKDHICFSSDRKSHYFKLGRKMNQYRIARIQLSLSLLLLLSAWPSSAPSQGIDSSDTLNIRKISEALHFRLALAKHCHAGEIIETEDLISIRESLQALDEKAFNVGAEEADFLYRRSLHNQFMDFTSACVDVVRMKPVWMQDFKQTAAALRQVQRK